MDVPRTFGATELFQVDGPYYPQLMEILETYSVYRFVIVDALELTRRPDVGYVQGMSYLAGMLLLYTDPYNTFVCFGNLLSNHFLISLFKMDIKQVIFIHLEAAHRTLDPSTHQNLRLIIFLQSTKII